MADPLESADGTRPSFLNQQPMPVSLSKAFSDGGLGSTGGGNSWGAQPQSSGMFSNFAYRPQQQPGQNYGMGGGASQSNPGLPSNNNGANGWDNRPMPHSGQQQQFVGQQQQMQQQQQQMQMQQQMQQQQMQQQQWQQQQQQQSGLNENDDLLNARKRQRLVEFGNAAQQPGQQQMPQMQNNDNLRSSEHNLFQFARPKAPGMQMGQGQQQGGYQQGGPTGLSSNGLSLGGPGGANFPPQLSQSALGQRPGGMQTPQQQQQMLQLQMQLQQHRQQQQSLQAQQQQQQQNLQLQRQQQQQMQMLQQQMLLKRMQPGATTPGQRLDGLAGRVGFGAGGMQTSAQAFTSQETLARALAAQIAAHQQRGLQPHNLLMMQQQLLMQQQQAAAAQQEAKEEEPEAPQEEGALEKVQKISSKLRSMLGAGFAGDRFAGIDEGQMEKAAAAATTAGDASGDAAPAATPAPPVRLSVEAQAAEDAATLEAAGKTLGGSSAIVRREDLFAACGDAAHDLKSYQLVGINFLMMLHRSGTVGGAILADEMGLGKTAQTICFLGSLRTKEHNKKPHLIVCPASLIENWQRELGRWCPGLRVVQYYGKDRAEVREKLLAWRKQVRLARKEGRLKNGPPPGVVLPPEDEDNVTDEPDKDPDADLLMPTDEDEAEAEAHLEGIHDDAQDRVCGHKLPPEDGDQSPFDVMLATYTMFERESDYKEDRLFLTRWDWSYLVADEAHALKNRSSIRTKKLRRVALGCEHRLLLTGTPLQNSLEELRALLEFLMPSLFGGNDADSESAHPTDDEEAIERYKSLLAPFILRRLKSEVANQLAKKAQVVKELEMTVAQQQLYKKAVESMRKEVAEAHKAAAAAAAEEQTRPRGRPKGSKSRTNSTTDMVALGAGQSVTKLSSQRVNNIFTHLRKVAQHPLLVRNHYTDEDLVEIAQVASTHGLYAGNCSFERVHKELTEYNDFALHRFAITYPLFLGKFILPEGALMTSAKLVYLRELLHPLRAKGSRVLLFSQWTTVLDVMEWFMEKEGFTYVRLDGNTQVDERLKLVDKFNDPANGVFIFLLSTRAGGQGLNLTGADTVVLHDVDFNPQVDRQAEDRCHRLGQTKPVTVYRLVTKGTVDESILGIADRKLALDAAVLEGFAVTASEGGAEGAEGGEGKAKKGKKGEPAGETRYMGAILAALLADE